ncbi:aminotransferase class V-fold PLP-dependent enzyme [Brevundimonas sp. SORGH_AS_0993]|uniref:aminotransferase class V-fold PLP-dependent enzyme n=1 Tax=Brevundimonas sp. SORGH_AS_0993 TaxID=3041794 RepID=UPI002786A0BF|nr:aminotransferase class V-fold PLP-dependent enzyme [Brevundimonas sp. SORGH_AS_0993]MDQ1155514.1 selenocysteine lyase/cysteine desulfurase [Brevundimonas sp. SORGH_AS_0993]
MHFTRRALIAAAAVGPATGLAQPVVAREAGGEPPLTLPARAAFATMPMTYLDSGATHPMPLGARAALEDYLRYKTRQIGAPDLDPGAMEENAIRQFATLVGAEADELCFVQSTSMGENLVLQALDIPATGGRIVTDALHFFGSFYTYGELAKAGMDVVTLPMTPEGRIDMAAMEAAVNTRTRLVSISHVSTINGFEHDLKRVCDLAHAHGAYVYVDIVHGAGSTPLDLKAAGVDFAACASYKWLMGDFGLGFLYVRKTVQEKIRRPWWGYHQVRSFQSHAFPHDPPGPMPADYAARDDATGRFAMGTTSWTGAVQLDHSLTWINRLGVDAIQRARRPLVDAVQTELRRRGYEPLTPLDSRTALVAFALKDARPKLSDRLAAANVRITVSQHRFRVSLAVFNDMNDVDRLLETLPATPPA